jgi:hypothetical protein
LSRILLRCERFAPWPALVRAQRQGGKRALRKCLGRSGSSRAEISACGKTAHRGTRHFQLQGRLTRQNTVWALCQADMIGEEMSTHKHSHHDGQILRRLLRGARQRLQSFLEIAVSCQPCCPPATLSYKSATSPSSPWPVHLLGAAQSKLWPQFRASVRSRRAQPLKCPDRLLLRLRLASCYRFRTAVVKEFPPARKRPS